MRKLNRLALFAALSLCMSAAFAADPSIRITAPADGAKLDAKAQTKVVYEVVAGAKGDHTHLYIDGKETAVLRQLKGSHTLEPLAAGDHQICIKIVNKGHTPIGVEQCIKVTAQ